MRVVVFGGAGFIGSHLVDKLIDRGDDVVVFDNLDPQVHGTPKNGKPAAPDYLNTSATLHVGDVRDEKEVDHVLAGADSIVYLAAAVGVGQSMYEIRRYTDINSVGAATVLEKCREHLGTLQKMVVASSMSIYGEGSYRTASGEILFPALRSADQLMRGEWEYTSAGGEKLAPIGTAETKPLRPTSIYAINKRDHEEMFLAMGGAYQVPATALRFFNAYGPRQALSNPYTGVAAIFSSMILNGKRPRVYEDGLQMRDFVHISDIVQGIVLAMDKPEANGEIFNVGSGAPISVLKVSEILSAALGFDQPADITGKYRVGDIRHCFADIGKANRLLGFKPQVSTETGLAELCAWVSEQQADDNTAASDQGLTQHKLLW